MARRDAWGGAGTAAAAAAAVIIAQHVAAKATRDTLFLSSFPVGRWPTMLAWASIVSIGVAVVAGRAMARLGPGRVMPATCALSAALLLGIATLATAHPGAAAVLLFLQVAAIGPIVISGFWSLFNERFDPRSARRAIARVGGFGTLGGLAGGLMGNEVAKRAGMVTMLPILAALHLLAAVPLHFLARETRTLTPASKDAPSLDAGFHYLVKRPYLRDVGLLMLLTTASAALLDFVFRQQASKAYSGDQLMAVFSTFHSAVALLAFLLQISLIRLALDRVPVSRAVATLPAAVLASCLGVLAFPGVLSSAIARGIETVMSNSIFRLGYELLYTPVAPNEAPDQGAHRRGCRPGRRRARRRSHAARPDAVGPPAERRSADRIRAARRARTRGLAASEPRLRARARGEPEKPGRESRIAGAPGHEPDLRPHDVPHLDREAAPGGPASGRARRPASHAVRPVGIVGPAGAVGAPPLADTTDRQRDLVSGDVDRARRALGPEPLPVDLVPWAIPLLADDGIAPEVTRALRKAGPQAIDPLVQTLLDPERPVEVRRRIPRILSAFADERVVQGLLRGLEDVRFRVRLQCGWALAHLHEVAPELPIDRERVLAAVLREVEIEKHVWGGHREMERLEDPADSPLVEDYVRERASASLQHIFTLLSAALPEQALLRLAYNGLHTDDSQRRGTALEYLDSVLPSAIKEAVWPFLEDRGRPPRQTRTREEIITELTSMNESMRIGIAELRKPPPEE